MEVLAFNPRIRGVDFSELVSKQKTKRTNKKNPKKQKQPNKEQTILFFFFFSDLFIWKCVCFCVGLCTSFPWGGSKTRGSEVSQTWSYLMWALWKASGAYNYVYVLVINSPQVTQEPKLICTISDQSTSSLFWKLTMKTGHESECQQSWNLRSWGRRITLNSRPAWSIWLVPVQAFLRKNKQNKTKQKSTNKIPASP